VGKIRYDWEKDLINPLSSGGSNKEWMELVEQRIRKKRNSFKRSATLLGSVAVIVLALVIFAVQIDFLLNLIPNWITLQRASQTHAIPQNKMIENQSQVSVDEQIEAVNYPPQNKVFDDQDQLPLDEKIKAEFIQKMAYAYQNIKTLKGKAENKNNNANSTIEFQLREGKNPASYEKITGSNGAKSGEYTNDNSYMWQRSSDGYDRISRVATRNPENELKQTFVSTASDGNPSYYFPSDPAWSSAAEDIVAPLRNLGWMVELNSWSFKGEESFLGRKVKVIEGKLPSYNAQKMHSDTYKVWVDDKTNMVLKKQFYDNNGNVVESFEVISIELNPILDNSIFGIPQERKN
jgi:hypothetical protein